MAILNYVNDKTQLVNEYECSQCNDKFVYENVDNGAIIKINFCPLCGSYISEINNN